MSSHCANRIDQWHEYGFEERLKHYLSTAHKHGISCMLVLSNECAVRTEKFQPAVFGEQPYQPEFHSGREFGVWYAHGSDNLGSILDDPAEIESIKEYNAMVDSDFASGSEFD